MARGITGLIGLVLLALSIVFAFFIILPGVTDSTPLSKTYFLQADTSGISGARDTTQWTYLYFCGEDNRDCGKARPAPAFGKAWDSNASEAPDSLTGSRGDDTTSSYYYFMWRFGWVWFLIALFFTIVAFFSGFLACCGRIGAFISSMFSALALVFWTLAAVFMTVVFVKARDAFQADGRDARLGRYAFGWAWGGFAAVLIATVLFCLNIRKSKKERYAAHPPRHRGGVMGGRRFPFFGNKGGVKDEYS